MILSFPQYLGWGGCDQNNTVNNLNRAWNRSKNGPASCVGRLMFMKVPPFIMKPEELGKNDMNWWLAILNLKRNLTNGAVS